MIFRIIIIRIIRESGTSASAPVVAAIVTLWNDMRLARGMQSVYIYICAYVLLKPCLHSPEKTVHIFKSFYCLRFACDGISKSYAL
jgi:hypothetical protein